MTVEPTQVNDEKSNEETFLERVDALPRKTLLALLLTLFLSLCLLLSGVVYWQNRSRSLKPERPSAVENEIIVDGQPLVVTFAELNGNANEYKNKWVQVAGSYFSKELLLCNPLPTNGPLFESVLVSDGLQLNIVGGEEALTIIALNTDMVVQGIWRLYTGPAGCGKEPPSDAIWYLDIRAVVQPNPIVGIPSMPIAGTPLAETLPPELGSTPTPNIDGSISTPTPIQVTVVIVTPEVTNTPTPGGLTPTPTTTVLATTTATVATFTRTPTPDPNVTPTATATATMTATPTVTGTPPTAVPSNTPLPSLPTATNPAGYPIATPTSSNPATSTPYP